MRLMNSHAALVAAASLGIVGLVGCAKDDMSRTHGMLSDLEAVRLAELHLDDTAPEASPRDVTSIEQPAGQKTAAEAVAAGDGRPRRRRARGDVQRLRRDARSKKRWEKTSRIMSKSMSRTNS